MPIVASGSFIPSFIHAHPQLSPTAACISLQLLEEVSGYCLHVQSTKAIPPAKEWGWWTAEP